MTARFLQFHTLTSYPASLLNRDDVGFAKRIPFGGRTRTRISSQCLKRHWRTAEDENALGRIAASGQTVPKSVRSRRTFERHIYEPLLAEGVKDTVARSVTEEILKAVLPEGRKRQSARRKEEEAGEGTEETSLHTEQVTVIGRPEVDYLLSLAREVAAGATNEEAARKTVAELDKGDLRKNLQALSRGAGLDAALFGRMTTGDILARCDAAIHVAHAFTIHDGQFETDYFSAIDDLQPREETGSGHINTSELSSGVFYGYVVVDLPLLVSNLEGCDSKDWEAADRSLAGEVVRRLVHLIATVSPGAKKGATAPYAYASMVLAEAGTRQPRTLANAFLVPMPVRGDMLRSAHAALARHLEEHDRMYGQHEERRFAAMEAEAESLGPFGQRIDLGSLAHWSAGVTAGKA